MEAAIACCCSTSRHFWRPCSSSHQPQRAPVRNCRLDADNRLHSGAEFRVRNEPSLGLREDAGRLSPCKNRLGSVFTASAVTSDNGAEEGHEHQEDQILRCISLSAEVSVIAVKATEVVQEAQRRHKASPTASAALGRALVGTLLLGAMKGDAETVQVTFRGQGPLGQVTTVAGKQGYVKGFVANPLCDLPLSSDGKLDVGGAIGPGVLSVVSNNSAWKQPFTGTISIYSGEVAEDLAHYLAESEQVNTAISLGVSFTKSGTVKAAGGFLVQILPFCSEETLAKLEDNIREMPPISDSETLSPHEMVGHLLQGIGVGDLSEPIIPRFGPCGVDILRPRMMLAVASLGPSQVQQLINEQGHVEVRCEFCAEVVRFQEPDLQDVFQKTSS